MKAVMDGYYDDKNSAIELISKNRVDVHLVCKRRILCERIP